MDINDMVRKEAKKAGVTDTKSINKAIKMIKNGKFNTAQLGMNVSDMFQPKSDDPRERLRKKLRDKRKARSSKTSLNVQAEKHKQVTQKRKEDREAMEKQKKKALKNKKQRHKKKLKQLEKKLGKISVEVYNLTQRRLLDTDDKSTQEQKNSYANIVELYQLQNFNKDDDIDIAIESEDEMSELSEDEEDKKPMIQDDCAP